MFKTRLHASFRMKIASSAFLTTCAALLVMLSLFFVRNWTAERERFVDERTISTHVIANNLSAALVFNDPVAAGETLDSARQIPDFTSAALFDKDGQLFASQGDVDAGPHVHPRGLDATRSNYTSDALHIHVPVSLSDATVGELVVVLGLGHFKTLLWEYVGFTLLSLLLVAGAASLVGSSRVDLQACKLEYSIVSPK